MALIELLKRLCYNATERNSEDNSMDENKESKNSYGFLFKKSTLPKANLSGMLQFEDFVQKMDEIMSTGKGIEDVDIYNITIGLYFPMLKNHQTEGFKEVYKAEFGTEKYKEWSYRFRIIGLSAKAFSKALYGDLSKYESDYHEFLSK